MMLKELLRPEIKELITQRRWGDLRQFFETEKWPIPDIADLLLSLEKPDRVLLFRALSRGMASEVFSFLEPSQQSSLLQELTDEESRSLLASLSPDDRTLLLEELPGPLTQRLLTLLPYEELKEARWLLGYPEGSVGRLMTPDYVAVRADWEVGQALEHIRKVGKDSETINIIYVTDEQGRLLDDIELRRLVIANPQSKVSEIMDHSFVSVLANADREEAVSLVQKYDLYALPVVDSDGILLGIVTVDDILDVAQDEATEDFHKTAAVAPIKVSYREASVWLLFKRRIGWLAGLAFADLISSGVIATFEATLRRTIALAFFMPLLVDSGGNGGSQVATLMIRALATGDVKLNEWISPFLKEILVGLLLAVAMGILGWGFGIFRGGLAIGAVVGLSMGAIILFSNLIGFSLPFILAKLGVDPAVASSPLITSLADGGGLAIYFIIARMVLGG
uniref:Magnesium transporter MgtE n=1 Tax=candidate division WOR-3 bacterium TaxID=2052148 RepID=A0A7C3YSC5_UNCW3